MTTTTTTWTEEDILARLKDDSQDEHRNFIYPDQAQAILDLLKKKDAEIARVKALISTDPSLASLSKWGKEGPPPGTSVVSIRAGFSSMYPGVKMTVLGVLIQKTSPPLIQLAARGGSECYWGALQSSWWKDFAVEEEVP